MSSKINTHFHRPKKYLGLLRYRLRHAGLLIYGCDLQDFQYGYQYHRQYNPYSIHTTDKPFAFPFLPNSENSTKCRNEIYADRSALVGTFRVPINCRDFNVSTNAPNTNQHNTEEQTQVERVCSLFSLALEIRTMRFGGTFLTGRSHFSPVYSTRIALWLVA